MLIPTILVTIRGSLKTLDLELPGDVSVGELIPLLLGMCGCQENDAEEFLQTVSLQVAGTCTLLSSDKTLLDAGVYDGAVLLLQTKPVPTPQVERLAPQQFVPKRVRPGVSTGGIGVTWKSLG